MLKLKMSRTFFSILLVILGCHHVKVYGDDDHCVRLTSAFNYNGGVYLVSGNEYFQIDSSFHEIDHGNLQDKFSAPEGEIDAALAYEGDLLFFKGTNFYSYSYIYFSGSSASEAATPSDAFGYFFKFGLDAATSVGWTGYFFHGCEYAKGYGRFKIKALGELGLPCHVDAAWNQDGKIYITLENDVWVMDENEKVRGPEPLSELLTMTTTSICPNIPSIEKVKAEQNYEREHQCTIIDAALTWEDMVFIFNDNEYIALDDEGEEAVKADIYKWGGLSGYIDAGLVWSSDDKTYFFQGDHFYEYNYVISFPRSNSLWNPFFLKGIDAAGNHLGTSYFFKGCKMFMYKGEYRDEGFLVIHSPDLNFPCDVDAAFSRVGTLYVIKRNQVWTWRADGEVADGPAPLSTVLHMTSWTACPPEEEEE